jgi:hypothetical protein
MEKLEINPKCPNCGSPIDWITFPGTCTVRAKVIKGKVDFASSEEVDWEPSAGIKELYCYNCGEDIHTLLKEY